MLYRRLLMVGNKKKKHKHIPKFTPVERALYVGRTFPTTSDFSTCAMYQVTYGQAAQLVQILKFTRAGLSRSLQGVPWQDAYGYVSLFGRDYGYLTPSGSAYPYPGGPNLPATIVEKPSAQASALKTLTGSYQTGTVRATASWLAAYAAKTNARAPWPFVSSNDNTRIIDPTYASGAYNLDPLVGPAQYLVTARSTSGGADAQTLRATGTVNAFPNPGRGVYTYSYPYMSVAGTEYPIASLNGDIFYQIDSTAGEYTGTSTSGGNSAAFDYTTSTNHATVWSVANSKLSISSEYNNPNVTNDGYQWSWNNAAFQGSVNYTLALPTPPIVRQDDPIAVMQYAVVPGGCNQAPDYVYPATAFYGEIRFLYKGFQAFPALSSVPGTTVPAVPDGTAPADTMPYWNNGQDFVRPIGEMVTAAAAAVPVTFYANDKGVSTAPGWGFSPYSNGGTAQKDVNLYRYDTGVSPGMTDVCGTKLITAYRSSHTSTTAASTGFFKVEDTSNNTTYTLNVLWANYFNIGYDDLLFYPSPATYTTDAAKYFCLFNQVASGSTLRDSFVAAGTAPNVTYTVSAALTYTATNTPFLWTVEPKPRPIGITGLSVDGTDGLFEIAYNPATCVGRRANMTVCNFLGQRGSVAYFFVTMSTSSADLCDINTIVPGGAGTKTYNGQTVKRMGVNRIERSFDAILAIDTSGTSGADIVVSAAAIRGTRSNPGTDIGQVLDGNGTPTGTYVDWANPGQAYARTFFRTGTRTSFGATLTCTATLLINAAADGKDYALDAQALNKIDLAALFQKPAQAGSVVACAKTPSGPPSGFTAKVMPHCGALLLLTTPTSTTTGYGFVSLDAATTWTAVKTNGDVTIFKASNGGYQGTGGQNMAPGANLFAY